MNESDGTNLILERLRELWAKRSTRIGVGIAAVALAVGIGVAIALAGGGGGGGDEQVVTSPTAGTSATPEATGTQSGAGGKTPIAVSPGDELTDFDLAQRGAGAPPRGAFNGDRLIIPKIGVDAPFTYKVVPDSGQMPNPNGPEDIAYYDFSGWAGMGGVPGLGGNVVLAGHVDYINHGPAVFWELDTLAVGDRVQIRLKDGTIIEYAIEFNKHIAATEADWEAIVAGTAEESITLITCGGEFSAGHYSDRQILWGRRVT